MVWNYHFDAAGNRLVASGAVAENGEVSTETTAYGYDARGRMNSLETLERHEDGRWKSDTALSFQHDGFGNRVEESRGNGVSEFSFDALGQVTKAEYANGKTATWTYDAAGNALSRRAADGDVTRALFDAAGRGVYSHADGTTTRTFFDAAGNVGVTSIAAKKYGFDEVSRMNLHYDAVEKRVKNSWVSKARGLRGRTWLSYDVNGQLIEVNRGHEKGKPPSIASYSYDTEGHIIDRVDRPRGYTDRGYLRGYNDPNSLEVVSERLSFLTGVDPARLRALLAPNETRGRGGFMHRWQLWQLEQGMQGRTAAVESHFYVDGKPTGRVENDSTLRFRTLHLDESLRTEEGITLQDSDLVHDESGALDLTATARALAERVYTAPADEDSAYAGFEGFDWRAWYAEDDALIAFNDLGERAQSLITDAVAEQLDGLEEVAAGERVSLNTYMDVLDPKEAASAIVTDLGYRKIGTEEPRGAPLTHTVQAGDTLESLAGAYFGSPQYWYLIADANRLQGRELPAIGTQVTIPNVVANQYNSAETYAVYDQAEIIGSTNPNIRVKPKKSSFFQKLVRIVIAVVMVVLMVVASLYVGPEVYEFFGPGIMSFLAATFAVAAVGFAASFATQTLAIAAGLQDGYDWSAMRDTAGSFALSYAATGLADFVSGMEADAWVRGLAQVGVEAGRQHIAHGRVTNWSGVALAALPASQRLQGDSWWKDTVKFTEEYRSSVSAGLSALEAAARGNENALHWTHFAAAAVGDLAGGPAGGERYRYRNAEDGSWNWGAVGTDVAFGAAAAVVVGNRLGEDAGLDFFGQAVGGVLGRGLVEGNAISEQQRQVQALYDSAGINYRLDEGGRPIAESAATERVVEGLLQAGVGDDEIVEFLQSDAGRTTLAGADQADRAMQIAAENPGRRFIMHESGAVSFALPEPEPIRTADLNSDHDTVVLDPIVVTAPDHTDLINTVENVVGPLVQGAAALGELEKNNPRLAEASVLGVQLALGGPARFAISQGIDLLVGDQIAQAYDTAHGGLTTKLQDIGFQQDSADLLAHGGLFAVSLVTGSRTDVLNNARRIHGKMTERANNSLPPQRPTWRQSEIDVTAPLEQQGFRSQVSFKNGEEVPYGTRGSTRPEAYREGLSVEVKNYNVESSQGRSNLVRNVSNQAQHRAQNLPANTTQQVNIDVRGQNVSRAQLNQTIERMVERSNGALRTEDINILR